jgi:hypothetical protein
VKTGINKPLCVQEEAPSLGKGWGYTTNQQNVPLALPGSSREFMRQKVKESGKCIKVKPDPQGSPIKTKRGFIKERGTRNLDLDYKSSNLDPDIMNLDPDS